MANKTERLHETLVALTVAIYNDENFASWNDANAPQLGGFPGVYQFIIDAAQTFTEVEGRLFWDGEYFEAIDFYAAALLGGEDVPSYDERRTAALQSIARALETNGRADTTEAKRFRKLAAQ